MDKPLCPLSHNVVAYPDQLYRRLPKQFTTRFCNHVEITVYCHSIMWSVCLHATIELQWDQLTKGIALTGQIYRSLFRLNQTGKLWHHTKAVDFRLQVVVQNLGDQDKVVLISQPWFEAMDLHELMRFSVHISQSGWLLLLDRSKSLQTLIMYDWPFPEYFFLSNWALTVTICHSYKKKISNLDGEMCLTLVIIQASCWGGSMHSTERKLCVFPQMSRVFLSF